MLWAKEPTPKIITAGPGWVAEWCDIRVENRVLPASQFHAGRRLSWAFPAWLPAPSRRLAAAPSPAPPGGDWRRVWGFQVPALPRVPAVRARLEGFWKSPRPPGH